MEFAGDDREGDGEFHSGKGGWGWLAGFARLT